MRRFLVCLSLAAFVLGGNCVNVWAAMSAQERLDTYLPAFPKPNPEADFAALKIVDATGHFYRIPTEDWALGRRLVETDSAWAEWFAERRAALDAWMTERQDHVEWPCGYAHQYVHPQTGAYLPYSSDMPGDILAVPGAESVQVTDDIRAAWVNRFRKEHMGYVLEAARMYRLSGDKRYRDWAVAQLDFYADNFQDFVPYSGSPVRVGQLFGNQLNDATMTIVLAQAARLLWDDVTVEKRSGWGEKLFYPEVRLHQKRLFACPHNIACWQLSMIGLVAMLYEDDQLWEQVMWGHYGVREQLERGVTSNYIWFEQSMGYNLYVAEALTPLFREAAVLGRMEEVRREAAIYENLLLSVLQLRFPNGVLPNLADVTGRTRTSTVTGRLADIVDFMPTHLGTKYASRRKDWPQLVSPVEQTDKGQLFPEVVSQVFANTDIAVLKHGAWQVFVQYGQLDANHSQREALSYEATYDTIPLTLNPGTSPYGSSLYKEYYRAGIGDNTPLVNGFPQESWQRGTLLDFSSEPASLTAAQLPFRSGYNAIRSFRLSDDSFLEQLFLEPEDRSSTVQSALGFTLHLEEPGQLEIPGEAVPVDSLAEGRAPGFRYWEEVSLYEARDQLKMHVVYGSHTFELIIRTAGPFRVYVGQAPGRPPEKRTAILVEKTAIRAAFDTEWMPVGER